MKKTNKLIFIVLALFLIYILISYFYILPNYKTSFYNFTLISWAIIALISFFLLNHFNFKRKIKSDTIQIVIISTISYFVLYFILGIFIGFTKNPLAITLENVVKNLSINIAIILFEEYTRSILLFNSKNDYLKFIYIIILFTLIGIIYDTYIASFTNGIDYFKYFSMVLFPVLSKNILLTYMSNKVNFVPSFIYRIIMELYIYVLPIYPNAGEYIDTILLFLFPFIVLYYVSNTYQKNDSRTRKRPQKRVSKLGLFIATSFVLTCILLISGFFKYQAIAVVSNSMSPYFKRGDSVIFEHINQDEDLISIGDVLVYKKDSIYVVHRVVKKTNEGIITKGDSNEHNDLEPVTEDQIIGIQKIVIPYVGYPSVWLQELLAK